MKEESQAASRPNIDGVIIKVVYDNYPYADGLQTAWGFSALISGTKKTILFDTGGNGSLLLDNMEKLAIDPSKIDVVVLSHIHGDHTGGLSHFLQRNPNSEVYVPKSFPKKSKENIQKCGAKLIEVKEPLTICEDVYSTGQLGKLIKEQSIIVRTKAGLIVITGCAHPGILRMVDAATNSAEGNILLVMGGFHLEWATTGRIEKTISAFKQWHVQYVGPCHCCGHKARSLFEKCYGKNYINTGAGKVIAVAKLP